MRRSAGRALSDASRLACHTKATGLCKDIIAKIEGDERYHYEPALVQINAPLALIQVDLKARHLVATRILAALEGKA